MTAARRILLVAVPFALACPGLGDESAGDVPDRPTWDEHIQPIMDDHCVLCHGENPVGGAPSGFRLDQYADEGSVDGGFTMGERIEARASDGSPSFMPPGETLDPTSRETISKWVDIGKPEN